MVAVFRTFGSGEGMFNIAVLDNVDKARSETLIATGR